MQTHLRYLWAQLGSFADNVNGNADDFRKAEYTSQPLIICGPSPSTAVNRVIPPSLVPGANQCPASISGMFEAKVAIAQQDGVVSSVPPNKAAVATTERAGVVGAV